MSAPQENAPATPRTPGNFPPPPFGAGTPAATAVGTEILAQRNRFALYKAEAGNLDGLTPEMRSTVMRAAEVESLSCLRDFDPSFTPAIGTVKVIMTPTGPASVAMHMQVHGYARTHARACT